MTDLFMGDMSNPGTLDIKEDAVAFYIGGNTPHVWTLQQIERQTAAFRHPIWTYGLVQGQDGGIIEGYKITRQLKSLGVPLGVAVSIDMETQVDPQYLDGVNSVISSEGYHTSVYGSKSTIMQNPVYSGGRWVADWLDTGAPHLTGIPGEWACQYVAANSHGNDDPWDVSLVKDKTKLWDPAHVTPRYAVLVEIPSGVARTVKSMNEGKTWQ